MPYEQTSDALTRALASQSLDETLVRASHVSSVSSSSSFDLTTYLENQEKMIMIEMQEEQMNDYRVTNMSLKEVERTGVGQIDLCVVKAMRDIDGSQLRVLKSKSGKAMLVRQFKRGDCVKFHTTVSKSGSTPKIANKAVFVSATIVTVTNKQLVVRLYNIDDDDDDDDYASILTGLQNGSQVMQESRSIFYAMFQMLNLYTYRVWLNTLKDLAFNMQSGISKDVLKSLFYHAPCAKQVPLVLHASITHQNESQRKAMRQSQDSSVLLIHGPPGTGKSTALVSIIENIVLNKKRVLVCAASNTAVDQLMIRQCKSKNLVNVQGNLVRMGKSDKIAPALQQVSLLTKVEALKDARYIKAMNALKNPHQKKKDRRKLQMKFTGIRKEQESKILNACPVIASTLTVAHTLSCRDFDYVIIDEAAQAIEVACLAAILKGKKLILAGDHLQLPPTVKSSKCKDMEKTLFERCVLDRGNISWLPSVHPTVKNSVILLDTQHRMNHHIMDWSSDNLYDGKLKAAASVKNQLLSDTYRYPQFPILQRPWVLVNTHGQCQEDNSGDSKVNFKEIKIVLKLLKFFTGIGIPLSEIGVISPYKAQVRELEERMGKMYNLDEIEVKSVDGFQGSEKTVIILSCVRSNNRGEVGFLRDHRRMNVAVTRAKKMVCIIGDATTLGKDTFLRTLFKHRPQWTVDTDNLSSQISAA